MYSGARFPIDFGGSHIPVGHTYSEKNQGSLKFSSSLRTLLPQLLGVVWKMQTLAIKGHVIAEFPWGTEKGNISYFLKISHFMN